MTWDFNGDGSWDAASRITADGSMLYWRIGVCDDGTFDVSESCSELTDRKQTFPTLSEAKRWCEQQEQIQFSEACKPLPEHMPPDDPTESQVHGACMWFVDATCESNCNPRRGAGWQRGRRHWEATRDNK